MNLKKTALFCTLCTFSVSYSENVTDIDETKLTKENGSLSNISAVQKKSPIAKGQNVLKIDETLNLHDEFTKHESGLSYKIIQEGSGSKPYPGEIVTVHYTGYLLEGNDKVGQKFDSSVDRGQQFQFVLGAGQVIKGWDISLADMKIGEKRIIVLPPELAYGKHGAGGIIKPNATLIFEVELFKAQ